MPTSGSEPFSAPLLRTGPQAFPEFFSGCSVEQLAEFMDRAQPSCLHKPVAVKTLAMGPRCGNAMLDPGEECDCGTVEVKSMAAGPFKKYLLAAVLFSVILSPMGLCSFYRVKIVLSCAHVLAEEFLAGCACEGEI